MTNNCIYCKKELSENSVVDVCNSCGHKVWGEKMFQAIQENMKKAKDVGDLYQGSVSDDYAIESVEVKKD